MRGIRAFPVRSAAKACVIAFAFVLLADTALAQKEAGFASLILTSVSAERNSDEVTFTCGLKIDNETGADLAVQSSFRTPFGDLELVVTDLKGKVLSQQPHSYHLSAMHKERRPVTLKRGETETKLRFEIVGFPRDEIVKVRVVGTFPGSAYKRICSSETIEVSIDESLRNAH
jgi:hypothetical protein